MSTIALSGLTVTPGFGQSFLHWSIIDPNTLTYHKLDAVEIWAAASNDRTTASKVSEAKASDGINIDTTGAARWYWIRARDLSGDFSAWEPASPIGGVSAPATGSIGPGGTGTSGYMKLPNGLILQWGSALINVLGAGVDTPITLPVTFPNALFSVQVTPAATTSSGTFVAQFAGGLTSTTFNLTGYKITGGVITQPVMLVTWFAVGY